MSSQMRVVVTGGSSGIGRAVVRRALKEGAEVGVIDQFESEHNDRVYQVVCDVSNAAEVQLAMDNIAAHLGGIDVLVNSAGVASRGSVADLDLSEWERVLGVNVTGVMLCSKFALRHMSPGSAIVNVASQLGLVGASLSAAYCASKGAVINLTRAMALDHGPDGIRVNAVCPGPTETEMAQGFFAASASPEDERRLFESTQVHGRLATPDEIAGAIWYLASPQAGSTIGAILTVDGGYTAR